MLLNAIAEALSQLTNNLSDLASDKNSKDALHSVYLTDRNADLKKEYIAQYMPDLFVERQCYNQICNQLRKAENNDMHSMSYSQTDLSNMLLASGASSGRIDDIINAIMLKLTNNKHVSVQLKATDAQFTDQKSEKIYVLKW